MKDIEKLFEEKLKNHQVIPPGRTWDELQQKLQGQSAFPLYWKIAASVILFLSVLGVTLLYHHHTNEVTEQTEHYSSPETDSPVAQKADLEPMRNQHEQDQISESVSTVETKEIHDSSSKPDQRMLKEKNFEVKPSASLASSAPESWEEIQKLEPNAIQMLTVTSWPNTLSGLRVMAVRLDVPSNPVIITYKASRMSEKNESVEKAFAFLDQIKSAHLSLAELRQAKDELITKAFTPKEKGSSR